MRNIAVISLVTTFLVSIASLSLGTEVELTTRLVPSMYVFGDSLVDVGNNDYLPSPPAPRALSPYGIDNHGITGRFTNGYNIADLVAQRLGFTQSPPAYLSPWAFFDLHSCRGVGGNYASGGSGILNTTGNGTLTLEKQIQLFNKTKLGMWCRSSERDDVLSKSLFLISAGGNDFSAFSERGMAPEDAPAYITSMISTYVKHINALYKLGARKLAILDVPAIGCTPGARVPMPNNGCNDAANSLAKSFNKFLRVQVASAVTTSMPGMKYSIASTYNFLSDLMANPLVAGLVEVETACCGSGKLNAEVMCSGPNTTYCSNRGEYVFWDKLHPTTATCERAVVAIFYDGSQKYAEPINFAGLIPSIKDSATTPDVYSI